MGSLDGTVLKNCRNALIMKRKQVFIYRYNPGLRTDFPSFMTA